MPTSKSSITVLPYPQSDFICPLVVQGAIPSVRTWDSQGAVMSQPPEGFDRRLVAFFRECWWSMREMKAAFEQADDGARSRERSAKRFRGDQAWSRIGDEG